MCIPKNRGLGFRYFKSFNLAFLAKLAWNMVNEGETLWIKLLKARYIGHGSFFDCEARQGDFYVRKGLLKTKPILLRRAYLCIGDDKSMNSWHDLWVLDLPNKILEMREKAMAVMVSRVEDLREDNSIERWQFCHTHKIKHIRNAETNV